MTGAGTTKLTEETSDERGLAPPYLATVDDGDIPGPGKANPLIGPSVPSFSGQQAQALPSARGARRTT